MFSPSFWKATAERVILVFAYTLLTSLFVGAEVLDIAAIRWGEALSMAGFAALLALLKCVVAGTGAIGPKGSPSLVADPTAANEPAPRVPVEPSNVHKVGGPITPTTNRATGRADLEQAVRPRGLDSPRGPRPSPLSDPDADPGPLNYNG